MEERGEEGNRGRRWRRIRKKEEREEEEREKEEGGGKCKEGKRKMRQKGRKRMREIIQKLLVRSCYKEKQQKFIQNSFELLKIISN